MSFIAKKGEWKFVRMAEGLPIWECEEKTDITPVGPYYVTFDKKIIYNLWGGANELTEGQKELVKKANPLMWELTLSGR